MLVTISSAVGTERGTNPRAECALIAPVEFVDDDEFNSRCDEAGEGRRGGGGGVSLLSTIMLSSCCS